MATGYEPHDATHDCVNTDYGRPHNYRGKNCQVLADFWDLRRAGARGVHVWDPDDADRARAVCREEHVRHGRAPQLLAL